MIKVDHYLLSSGKDLNVIIWDLRTCSFLKSICSTHEEPIEQLLLSPKSNCVISTSTRLLVCWDCYFPQLVSATQSQLPKI